MGLFEFPDTDRLLLVPLTDALDDVLLDAQQLQPLDGF
jgi:hypothetical protein